MKAYPNKICRLNGYSEDAITYIPVVVIGAGESGIAFGCRLKEKLGFDQFRIFDRQAGPGGTWWINRYPGCACDVPAIFYSFSFSPNHAWTSFHPPGPEIVTYLNDVCTAYSMTDKIQCNTDVSSCVWDDSSQTWVVHLQHLVPGVGDLSSADREKLAHEKGSEAVCTHEETVRAKIVISCVGGLVEPNDFPKGVPGADSFKGDLFHSARWRHDVNLNDKEVVVVGSGCSAAQLVPRLTKPPFNAKKVTQIMRSPPWVQARPTPPGGEELWSKYSPLVLGNVPLAGVTLRWLIAAGMESFWPLFRMDERGARGRKKHEKQLLAHLHETVPKKYHDMLTPNYSVFCKRILPDASWYPGLNDPKIELTTQPLKSVDEDGVTLGAGRTYPPEDASSSSTSKEEVASNDESAESESEPDIEQAYPERHLKADTLILANGYRTSIWLHPLKVHGRGGHDLVSEMTRRGGPQAYQGTAMDSFPNFFLIFGPNTATGHSSVILATENMVNYALKMIKPVLDGTASSVEVKKEAEEKWTRDVQTASKNTVFINGGCGNWYVDRETRWNGATFPWSQIYAWRRCKWPVWGDWEVRWTKRGLVRLWLGRGTRVLVVAMFVMGVWRGWWRGVSEKTRGVAGAAWRSLSSLDGLKDFIRRLLAVPYKELFADLGRTAAKYVN
ncbi:MAG: hypothetical protein M1831_005894 [Alyxoria varia]|nr:MAG: hypothetical protein M1831_005894 [Alyxoria varia]